SPTSPCFPYTTLFRSRPAKMAGNEFRRPVRRGPGPGPAGMVHVVGFGRPQYIHTAEFVHRTDVILDLRTDAVLRQKLADRAVLRSEEHTSELQSRENL